MKFEDLSYAAKETAVGMIQHGINQAVCMGEDEGLDADGDPKKFRKELELFAAEPTLTNSLWISIKNKLPSEWEEVLVFGTWRSQNESLMDVGHIHEDVSGGKHWSIAGRSGVGVGDKVTHWTKLPELPK